MKRSGLLILLFGLLEFAGAESPKGAEKARREAIDEIKKLGGTFDVVKNASGKPVLVISLAGTKTTDAGLECLQHFNELKRLYLGKTALTDGGMAHLKSLANVEELSLHQTKVTDRECVK